MDLVAMHVPAALKSPFVLPSEDTTNEIPTQTREKAQREGM